MFGWRKKEEVALLFIKTNGPDDALLYPAIIILIISVLSSVITIPSHSGVLLAMGGKGTE